ncbi:MAG: glutaredoxin 3 [Pseudomonadales bacterium]|nr:glutaredoxin 3 [Pseudomonadales bacterium]
MAQVTIYVTPYCPYCIRARHLLDAKGADFHVIDVSRNPTLRAEMEQKSQRHTVPQIWIGEKHIGGCDDLMMLERSGELDNLLS